MYRPGEVAAGKIDVGVAATRGAHFTGKQPHDRQPHPLAHAKPPQKLLANVLEGGTDRVNSGNRQARTSILRVVERGESIPKAAAEQSRSASPVFTPPSTRGALVQAHR